MARTIRRLMIAALATAVMPAWAAGQSPAQLRDLTLEDLMRVSVQNVFGASERLQPVTEAPASVTIVTADEIRRYGYRTLADILRSVRGFYIRDDRTYSYVGVRGISRPGDYNSRVLLLVNGHKVNDNIYDQAYIGAELGIDVAMFERVEIIRGPASSLYGTSAFFAVINVITRTGASIHGASLEADAGTLGSQLARASYGRQLANGVDLAVSGTYERTLGVGRLYFPAFDASGENHGIAENLDGEKLGELYARLKLRDLTLVATYGQREKDVPTAAFGTVFNSQSPRQRMSDRHTMIDAQYNRVVGGTHIAVDLAFDRLYTDGIYPYPSDNPDVPLLINHDSADGARLGVGAHVTRALPGQQTLTVGGEFLNNFTQTQWDTYNDPLVPGFTIDQPSQQSAVYLQDEIRIRPWLMVNAGLRYDRYERFAKATPRGAVIVTPSANQSFKYLFGRAFRAPNAYELYYYGDAGYLRPESIGTHELVWEQYVGEWLRTSVSAYHSTASQLITLESSDPSAQFQFLSFFNDGTVHAKGLEFESEVRTNRGLQLLGSYTLQETANEAKTPVTNSPEHIAKLRFSAPGPFARSVGSVEVQYLSTRRTLAGLTVAPATVAHATFNVPITHSFELFVMVRNLFNQQFADPASTELISDSIQQNGRTARIGLRWSQGSR